MTREVVIFYGHDNNDEGVPVPTAAEAAENIGKVCAELFIFAAMMFISGAKMVLRLAKGAGNPILEAASKVFVHRLRSPEMLFPRVAC